MMAGMRNAIRNPSAEGDGLSLIGGTSGTTTVAIVNDAATGRGARSFRVSATTAATAHARSNDTVNAVQGQKWWARCAARLDPTAYGPRRLYAELRFHGADGSTLGTSVGAAVDFVPDGVYRRWTGAVDASVSEEYRGTVRRSNILPTPRGTAGVVYNGAETVTNGVTCPPTPSGNTTATRVSWSAAGVSNAGVRWNALGAGGIPAGAYALLSAWVLAETAAPSFAPAIPNVVGGSATTLVVGQWVRVAAVLRNTGASANPSAGIRATGSTQSAGSVLIADAQVEIVDASANAADYPYFDGAGRTPIQGLYRYWTETAGASASVEKSADGATRINVVQNPSLAIDGTAWSNGGNNSGVARVSRPDARSGYVLTAQQTGTNAYVYVGTASQASYVLAAPGAPMVGMVRFRQVSGTLRPFRAQFNFRTAAGAGIAGADVAGTDTTPNVLGEWTWAIVQAPMNATAYGAQLQLRVVTNPDANVYEVDTAFVEVASNVGSYFDGGTIDPALILPTGMASAPQTLVTSGMSPAGTSRVSLAVYRDAAVLPASSDVWYVDDMMLTQWDGDAVPDYADGSVPGWYWGGPANASQSILGALIVGPPDLDERLGIQWNGTNGSTWDIAAGPVRAAVGGIKGFGMPDVNWQTSKTVKRDGQRLRSFTRNPRSVFLPLRFKEGAALDVTGMQRAFWSSLGLGEYGTLVVTTADGESRSLRCRFEDDGSYAYTLDPYTAHVTAIGLSLTADDPYWHGDRISVTYGIDPSGSVNFFGGGDPAAANSGPPFVLSTSTGSQAYTIANPGDIDAWPVWSVDGPVASFEVGVGGRTIASSVAIPAGRTLVVNTDPAVQSATLVDTEPYRRSLAMVNVARVRFQTFSAIDFAPIPRGSSVALTMTITGSGTVGAAIDPRYERAF